MDYKTKLRLRIRGFYLTRYKHHGVTGLSIGFGRVWLTPLAVKHGECLSLVLFVGVLLRGGRLKEFVFLDQKRPEKLRR